MRTIKRRGAQYGDFRAKCGYCGVMWMRSVMIRDASNILACPDDQPGKDVVTLAQENAAGTMSMREAPQRDGADRDVGGDEYTTTPASIVDPQQLRGWWQPKQSGTILENGFSWIPNVRQFSEGGGVGGRRGAVAQGNPALRPAFTNEQVVFSGDFLASTRGDITAVDTNPTIWMVGSFTATGGMFTLRGYGNILVGGGVGLPPILQLGYDSDTNQVRADATYEGNQGGSNNGTFLLAFDTLPDAGLHLFRITQATTQLEIQIDDGAVATALTSSELTISGTSTPSAYDSVGYGLRLPATLADFSDLVAFGTTHTGRLEEVVVMSSNATAAQLTSMRTYFKAQYPELP